jgi:hypothetical protein
MRGTSFSFQMILDRTNDLKNAPNGIMDDINVLSKIVTGGVGGVGSRANVAVQAPVQVVFSRAVDLSRITHDLRPGHRKFPKNPLGCTGFVVDFSVDIFRFNRDMIPTRGIADLAVRIDYLAPDMNQVISAKSGGASAPPTRRQPGTNVGSQRAT